jgi:hypothetical protein
MWDMADITGLTLSGSPTMDGGHEEVIRIRVHLTIVDGDRLTTLAMGRRITLDTAHHTCSGTIDGCSAIEPPGDRY